MRVEHRSTRDDWLTPVDILDRARAWMGAIDLDPCSDGSHVPAEHHFTKEINGLSRPWTCPDGRPATIFMNPPYNKHQDQRRFVDKLLVEAAKGHITRATLLLAARTDTRWHWRLGRYPRCYVRGRLKFLHSETKQELDGAPFPSVVFAIDCTSSLRYDLFHAAFSPLGDILVPYSQWHLDL